MISLILAEDHVLVREGLKMILEEAGDIEIIAGVADGLEAVKKVEELSPDMIIIDISMPNLNGIQATSQIKRKSPDTRILVLSRHKNDEYVLQSIRAGADGYLIKNSAPAELIDAIYSVHQNKGYLSPAISKIIIDDYFTKSDKFSGEDKQSLLTEREHEVLQLLAEGHSTKDIAKKLFISVNTVATHREHIFDKLNLKNIVELTLFAVKKGIIDPDNI
ncbi:MAG: response regulator transcription factor [Candidatus Neomarinimicrobiota bacterium]